MRVRRGKDTLHQSTSNIFFPPVPLPPRQKSHRTKMSHPTTEPPGPSSSSTQALITCDNFIQGKYQPSSSSNHYLPVISPVDNTQVGNVCISNAADVDMAVACAQGAFPGWSGLTMKARASIMFRFQHLMEIHAEELAQLVVRENGKNIAEARASVAKGNETVEWACGLPQMAQGKILQVSRGVTCSDMREPIGVVASVSPLNFPIMCPMWTIPIALTAGNCVILKPSEKVPLTMHRVAALLHEAGVPPGVFQTVNGTAEAVNALIDHPGIAGVTFVGSSRVAELVANRATKLNKRVLAMGGAKNHLVALPDCEVESAASDIVASFAGCAGQRCMVRYRVSTF
jgi:acyl-CoA reductase-like NAD-dependent aldehyde dehydrogenase